MSKIKPKRFKKQENDQIIHFQLQNQMQFEAISQANIDPPTKKPNESLSVLKKTQKLTKCDVCKYFGQLQKFSQFDKKKVHFHIESFHSGKIQCKNYNEEHKLSYGKPIEIYDATIFLCSNCSNWNEKVNATTKGLPQIQIEEIQVTKSSGKEIEGKDQTSMINFQLKNVMQVEAISLDSPIQKPDENMSALQKKQKLNKCEVCKDFAELQEFSQFEKRTMKMHIKFVHDGKIQCKVCDNEYTLSNEKPIETYDPTIFLCSNCSKRRNEKFESSEKSIEGKNQLSSQLHIQTQIQTISQKNIDNTETKVKDPNEGFGHEQKLPTFENVEDEDQEILGL